MKKKEKTPVLKSSKSPKPRANVTYVYLKMENQDWVKRMAIEMNQTYSHIVDRCIEAHRIGIPLTFEKKIPAEIQYHALRRAQRLQKMSEQYAQWQKNQKQSLKTR